MFALSTEQVAVLSFFVMVATQGVKIWRSNGGSPMTKGALTWLSLAIASVFGLLWADLSLDVSLPVLADDPTLYIQGILDIGQVVLAFIVEIFAVVVVVYNYIVKQVFDNIGFAPK